MSCARSHGPLGSCRLGGGPAGGRDSVDVLSTGLPEVSARQVSGRAVPSGVPWLQQRALQALVAGSSPQRFPANINCLFHQTAYSSSRCR